MQHTTLNDGKQKVNKNRFMLMLKREIWLMSMNTENVIIYAYTIESKFLIQVTRKEALSIVERKRNGLLITMLFDPSRVQKTKIYLHI